MQMAILIVVLYFFPTLLGCKKKNSGAIFILNLFLGWTFVGWVVALVWACAHEAPDPVTALPPVTSKDRLAAQIGNYLICSVCREKNNPSFSVCWKCGESLTADSSKA